jgi:hypothetical protein
MTSAYFKILRSPRFTFARRISIPVTVLGLALATNARGQESVADAARNARQRQASSANHHKIITNADIGALYPAPSASAFHLQPISSNADETPNPSTPNPGTVAACDNPQAQRLRTELQAAQQELSQLRRELLSNPPVISDHDLDPQYFRPGNSGLNVGTPPLLDDQPPAPPRVSEVQLQERIDFLNKALRLACEPPEAARIQAAIYQAEDELNLLHRQFALDQDDYYSRPVTERLGGNPQLDAERQQIQELQSEIERLKAELAALLPQAQS